SAVLPDAPARLDATIQRATAKQAESRFPNVGEFMHELRAATAAAADRPIGLIAGADPDRPPPATRAARLAAPTPAAGRAPCTRRAAAMAAADNCGRTCGAARPAAAGTELDARTVVMTAEELAQDAAAVGETLLAPPGAIEDTVEAEPSPARRAKRR